MVTNTENYAEIIPLRRMARDLDFFDYKIPRKMKNQAKVGQLVQIDFQKKDFLGVICKIKNETDIDPVKIKEITSIKLPEPVVNEKQFKLAFWMAGYYHVSPSGILKSMVPKFTKLTPPLGQKRDESKSANLTVSKKHIPWLKKEVRRFYHSEDQCRSLAYPEESLLLSFLVGVTKKEVKAGRLTLVLAASREDLKKIRASFKKTIPQDKMAVITSDLSQKQYYYEWQKVWKNQVRVIVGTRLAVFLPLNRLNTIIVHREEDENHKQADQNPRFHARDAVYQLASHHRAGLLFTSQTPSLELYRQIEKGTVKKINPPKKIKRNVEVVSLPEEYKKKNYSVLSDHLQEKIKECLSARQSVFLFLNRKGEAAAFVCQDCHYLARCPDCLLPYSVHKKNLLVCRHCRIEKPIYLECPNCRGQNLKTVGRGTEKAERELIKIFPGAEIAKVDKDTRDLNRPKQIILGTEYALNHLPPQENLGLIGVLYADNSLYLPDFQNEEKTHELLTRVIHYAKKPVPTVIQTFTPDNKAIKSAAEQDYSTFLEKELILRKKLDWPPYVHLIKLICQHESQVQAKKTADNLIGSIKAKSFNEGPALIGPLPTRVPRVRHKFRYVILIKTKRPEDESTNAIIKLVPDDFIIDVDPMNLL